MKTFVLCLILSFTIVANDARAATTPTITWFTPANITYGTALSGTQLNAMASVPGTYSYTPPSGTVLNAGNNQTLSVLFTPDDTTNYTSATSSVLISILPKTLTSTGDPATKVYGTANPVFTGTLTGVVAGDGISATFTSPATPTTDIGIYNGVQLQAIRPMLADPNNRLNNYKQVLQNGTLTITPAALTVTANPAAKVYGTVNPFFSGKLTGVVAGDGIFDLYSSSATSSTAVGVYDASKNEAITPMLSDPNLRLGNYNVTLTSATLTVTPSPLTVTANPGTKVFGTINPGFTGKLTGVLGNDGITDSYASSATASTPVGVYDSSKAEAITPVLADPNKKLGNYAVTSTNATLTITPAGSLASGVNAMASFNINDQPIALSATATSSAGVVNEGTVTFQVSNGATPIGKAVTSAKVVNGAAAATYVLPGATPLGTFTIVATYSNGTNFSGSSDNSHTLTVASSFALASSASASPSRAGVGQTVTFSVAAAGSGIAYLWDFGDGSTGSGANPTHAYLAAGTYAVSVNALESSGTSGNSALQVTVVAPIIGKGLDSDGDGFSDSYEIAAGSDPFDPNSTPIGNGGQPSNAQALVLVKPSIALNFAKPLSDTIKFGGSVHVPAGFSPLNQKVLVYVGGIMKVFKLDAKGSAKDGADTLKFSIKAAKVAVPDQMSAFNVTLSKDTFSTELADEGLAGAKDAANVNVMVDFSVLFNGTLYRVLQPMSYSAKAGKSGSAK